MKKIRNNRRRNPKISIIMPAYNSEKFISQAIESIINQTFKDWELIIINDLSTDNTLYIAKQHQKKDKRIKIISLKENRGPAHARNEGMKRARGKYIANLDADDIAHKERLATQYNFLENNPSCFLVGSPFYYINEFGKILGEDKNTYAVSKERFEWATKIPNSSIMFRKSQNLAYKENLPPIEDFELLLNAAFRNFNIRILNLSLLYYRIHPSSLTTIKKIEALKLVREVIKIYKKYPSSLKRREELLKKIQVIKDHSNTPKEITIKRTLSALYESKRYQEYRALARKTLLKYPAYFRKEIIYYFISYLKRDER